MPTYMLDLTMTDRYLEDQPRRRRLHDVAHGGIDGTWEFREEWRSGSSTFYRMTTLIEAPHVPELFAKLQAEMGACFPVDAERWFPKTVQLVVRDIVFDLNDVLPYRYTKPRPRK
jgi:hypothetical protein